MPPNGRRPSPGRAAIIYANVETSHTPARAIPLRTNTYPPLPPPPEPSCGSPGYYYFGRPPVPYRYPPPSQNLPSETVVRPAPHAWYPIATPITPNPSGATTARRYPNRKSTWGKETDPIARHRRAHPPFFRKKKWGRVQAVGGARTEFGGGGRGANSLKFATIVVKVGSGETELREAIATDAVWA